MHADGAGTKSSLAYMPRKTGDISVWKAYRDLHIEIYYVWQDGFL
jgi:hypothetical protein